VERLARAAANYHEHELALKAERETLEEAISRAANQGLTQWAIVEILHGQGVSISRATVGRIIARNRA
jgi:hypothetical protein